MLNFLLNRKLVIGLIITLIFAVGVYAVSKLDQELLPSITFDETIVFIETEEMPAEDVEQFVTIPVEQAISNVDHIKDMESSTTNGSITMFVSSENGKGEEVTDEIHTQVQQLQSQLYGVKDVHVQLIATSGQYEFFLDVTGDDLAEVSHYTSEVIKPRLENLAEVNDVGVHGLEEKEIHITLKTDKLAEYDLSTAEVMQSIEQLNTNMSIGTLEKEDGEPSLRWNTSLSSIADVKNVDVQTIEGPIKLKDIAKVEEKTIEQDAFAWKNGETGFVLIQISRANGYTQIELVDAVRAEIEEIKKEMSSTMEINELVAQADYVRDAIDGVVSNILIGSIIAIVVLILFLRNVRATFIVGLSIPASILLTIISMVVLDYSFNLISLIALGLGVGMMVDASVVVLESIFKKKELGYSNREAVIVGTKEVVGAVIASMLTTIVVFVPISLMEDDIGKLMVILTVVVSVTLISSVVVAFTLIPALSENFLKLRRTSKKKKSRIIEAYGRMMEWVARKKRRRLSVITMFTIIFVSSFFLLTNIPMNVMPDIFNRYSEIFIELEQGVSQEEREEIAEKMNEELQKVQDVESNLITDSGGTMYASINLTPEEEKTREQNEINEEILERLRSLEDEYPIHAIGSSLDGYPSLPVQLRVSGTELDQVERIADDTVEKLAKIDGLVSVKAEKGESLREYSFKFNDKNMDKDGVSKDYIYASVSQIFTEQPLGELLIDGKTMPMKLSNDVSIENKNDLLKEKIPTINGEKELSNYVSLEKETSLNEINRYNGERYITIGADYSEGDLGNINLEIQEMINGLDVEEGYTVAVSGDLEEQQQAMQDLLMILAISIFLVFTVMAIQFNSLKHPFIILMIVPYTITGVLIGLFISQNELNVLSGIGVIMLVGIVLNNGILLIDRIKQLRNSGLDVYEAVVNAGKDRIRPIFITTLMTVGGMIPLALATGSASGYQSPLAVVIISGLLYSTLISLVLIPSFYLVFEDIGALVNRLFRKKKVSVRRIEAKAHIQ